MNYEALIIVDMQFLELPKVIQFTLLFLFLLVIIFIGLLVSRAVGIKLYGSERKYFKENNDPLTYKKIWIRSLIASGGATVCLLIYYLIIKK